MSDITVDKLEALQKKYDRLFELARKTRYHQDRHENFNTSVDKDKARIYRRQLDQLIKEEVKIRQSNQQELF